MIKTSGLKYEYDGFPPISFPDIEIEAGHSLLVSGESGCGKTTLLHLLAGLRSPTNGQIFIDGIEFSSLPTSKLDQFRGEHIGIVYQQAYFIESLSVKDNILISPYALGEKRAKLVSERLEIASLLNRYPKQLSVGQQQRVNIARAVMNRPKLLLADEPTSALDNKNCTYVIDLLLEESYVNDAALIIVTHDDRLKTDISDCIELNAFAH